MNVTGNKPSNGCLWLSKVVYLFKVSSEARCYLIHQMQRKQFTKILIARTSRSKEKQIPFSRNVKYEILIQSFKKQHELGFFFSLKGKNILERVSFQLIRKQA